MRILHILPSSYTGGVAQVVYDLCVAQSEAGHDVTLFLLRTEAKFRDSTGRFERLGVRTITSKVKKLYNPWHIFYIRRAMKKADLVHVHLFPEQPFAAVARQLLGKSHRPIMLTTEHSTNNHRRGKKILRMFDKLFYAAYDKIVCISPMTETNLKSWLRSERLCRKILTIANGVDVEKFNKAPSCLDKLIPSPDPSWRFVVMTSRLTPPKDPLTLLKAISLCPSWVHGVFIGDGMLREELEKQSEHLNITRRIHLLGNSADVLNLLKGCHIGVLSTQWDGFGLVAVEYMAAGLPVIATDVDGLREVVGDKGSLFQYGDAKGLADKILRLLEDESFYEEKKRYGLDRCREFSVEKMRAGYMALYDELLAARQNGLI